MKEYIEDFIDYLEFEKKYSVNTISSYEKDLEKYEKYLQSNKINFKKMNYTLVADYLIYLNKSGFKSASVNRHLSSIRSFYSYLLKRNITENNPFKLIKGPKMEKKLPNYLKYDEFLDLVSVCDSTPLGIRNRLIVELLFATGIRVSELVNLKIDDIDIQNREIRVLGKGNKMRIVYFNKVCKEVMTDYLDNYRYILLKGKECDYLLINHIGNKITRRGIADIIDKLILKSSIKHKISAHTLRHTFATLMLKEGMDIREVQELLGHKNLSTTSIYTHLQNNELRAVYLKYHPRNKLNK